MADQNITAITPPDCVCGQPEGAWGCGACDDRNGGRNNGWSLCPRPTCYVPDTACVMGFDVDDCPHKNGSYSTLEKD